ncbi:MAG: hypothetical protein ACP5HU_13290 [Phycisphaerae bacterium]
MNAVCIEYVSEMPGFVRLYQLHAKHVPAAKRLRLLAVAGMVGGTFAVLAAINAIEGLHPIGLTALGVGPVLAGLIGWCSFRKAHRVFALKRVAECREFGPGDARLCVVESGLHQETPDASRQIPWEAIDAIITVKERELFISSRETLGCAVIRDNVRAGDLTGFCQELLARWESVREPTQALIRL